MTRSANVSGRRGLAASWLISLSDIDALDGGCDHSFMAGGKGSVLAARMNEGTQKHRARARANVRTNMLREARALQRGMLERMATDNIV